MNKEIFLTQLREALQGNVVPAIINENMQYYENYIMQEIRKGKTEEDVLEELGNPRVLARTIIDTAQIDMEKGRYTADEEYASFDGAYGESGRYNENDRNNRGSRVDGRPKAARMTGMKTKVVFWSTILALILVVVGVIAMVVGIISFIAPVLIPLLIIMILVRILGRNR